MSEAGRSFPEYGEGGDYFSARRNQRAFRFSILACIVLTLLLWWSGYILRDGDQAELLFMRALTQEYDASARTFLRQAVRIEEQKREFPTPKYLYALAVREEDDLILPTYERAYKLDPNNAGLAIRYGCRLALEDRYAEARDRFREAQKQDEDNALPIYLEAAVLPYIGEPQADLNESLAMAARANNSGKPLVFPKPVWHSDLPQDGRIYADLRRRILVECSALINRFRDAVIGRAGQQTAVERLRYWDSCLETLAIMGQRLTTSAVPVEGDETAPRPGLALQALTGVDIELRAVRERLRLRAVEQATPDEGLVKRELLLQQALQQLLEFENARGAQVVRDSIQYRFPLKLMAKALCLVFLGFVLSFLLAFFAGASRDAWTIQHPNAWRMAFAGTGAFYFGILTLVIVLQRAVGYGQDWMSAIHMVWSALLAASIGLAVVYPRFVLTSAKDVAQSRGDMSEYDDVYRAARRQRRKAYMTLIRRYAGILLGAFLVASCAWITLHRIVSGFFPWEINLLTSGLAGVEAQTVRDIILPLL